MSRSSLIALTTFGSVAISAVISITWFVTASGASRFEPAVQTLGLLAGLTGVLAERRAAARERRDLTLLTLDNELRRSASVLDDPRFAPSKNAPRPRVYPRLPVSATDAALISGALAEHSDGELLQLLHNWRDEANGFNRRLDLTEMRIFTSGTPAEITQFEQNIHRSDGYLNQIRRNLRGLQKYLATNYPSTAKDEMGLGGNPGLDLTREIEPGPERQPRRT